MYKMGRKEVFGPNISLEEEIVQVIIHEANWSGIRLDAMVATEDGGNQYIVFAERKDRAEIADKLDLIEIRPALDSPQRSVRIEASRGRMRLDTARVFSRNGWSPGWWYFVFDDEVPFLAGQPERDIPFWMSQRNESPDSGPGRGRLFSEPL